MLRELVVRNFAIIRHLEVFFQAGLNVLTGETGAGKSILVGAVNLILGSRASQEMIRTGENEASVEAAFSLSDHASLRERLNDWGIEPGEELLIRRSINRNGRNRIFANGQLITLQQLQQMAEGLISISGQHEHQLLLEAERHMPLLDAFGGLESLCNLVAGRYSEWAKTRDELQKLRKFKKEQAAHLEWVRFQLQELEAAKLQPNEDELLEQERNLLKHAATLKETAQNSYQALYAGRGAVLEQLSIVEKDLQTLKRIDPTQEPLSNHLEQGRIHLEELAHALQHYAHHIAFDPQKLAAVEERLALLQRLGKKYGGSVSAMLERLKDLRSTLGDEEGADAREERLEKELAKLHDAYLKDAGELSLQRREAAGRLSKEVEKTLRALDMPRARFAVAFDGATLDTGAGATAELRSGKEATATGVEPEKEAARAGKDGTTPARAFTPNGIDQVEFLLSANPGEDLKPLAKVASGGELSRILLALKSLLSLKGEAETLLFDEVDAGIGGRTAELVGIQLKGLAGRHQVICITHLAQIACYGEHHFQVAKKQSGEETVSSIRPLPEEERVEELARMIGGISISETTREHAAELLRKREPDRLRKQDRGA